MDGVSLAHQKRGGKEKTPAKSCSDWLTRTLMIPSPLISPAAKRPGRGAFPITKATMRTISEISTVPSPLTSPRMNAGLGGAEQLGGPVRDSALFGGVHSRSGLSAVLLQKYTSSLKNR